MKKLIKFSLPVYLLVLIPSFAHAQQMLTGTGDFILRIGDIVSSLVVLATAIALLVFIWGIARFIFKIGGDEKAIEQGKTLMKWGLVGLFVMASVWGLVNLMQRELLPGVDMTAPQYPLL